MGYSVRVLQLYQQGYLTAYGKTFLFSGKCHHLYVKKNLSQFCFFLMTYYVFLIKIKGTRLSPSCCFFKLLLYDCLTNRKENKNSTHCLTERKCRYFHFLNQTGCHQKHCCFNAVISLVLLQQLSDDLSALGAMSAFSKCFFSFLPHGM